MNALNDGDRDAVLATYAPDFVRAAVVFSGQASI